MDFKFLTNEELLEFISDRVQHPPSQEDLIEAAKSKGISYHDHLAWLAESVFNSIEYSPENLPNSILDLSIATSVRKILEADPASKKTYTLSQVGTLTPEELASFAEVFGLSPSDSDLKERVIRILRIANLLVFSYRINVNIYGDSHTFISDGHTVFYDGVPIDLTPSEETLYQEEIQDILRGFPDPSSLLAQAKAALYTEAPYLDDYDAVVFGILDELVFQLAGLKHSTPNRERTLTIDRGKLITDDGRQFDLPTTGSEVLNFNFSELYQQTL